MQEITKEALASRCLETMRTIAKSPALQQFKVGYSSDLPTRTKSYLGIGYEHVVGLASGLTRADALWLEEALTEACCRGPKTSILYKKYNEDIRGSAHRRSSGGRTELDSDRDHIVYMAWWN